MHQVPLLVIVFLDKENMERESFSPKAKLPITNHIKAVNDQGGGGAAFIDGLLGKKWGMDQAVNSANNSDSEKLTIGRQNHIFRGIVRIPPKLPLKNTSSNWKGSFRLTE